MDDFYVYYETESDSSLIGDIKAVAPIQLAEMEDMNVIRVPAEVGLSFTKGSNSISRWSVRWNPDSNDMQLVEQNNARSTTIKFLKIVPVQQEKAQLIITWKASESAFNIRTRGVSVLHPNITMVFFVTRYDDPNIPYFNFTVPLLDTMNRKGYDLSCDVELPETISVYTKHELDRYQLRIE